MDVHRQHSAFRDACLWNWMDETRLVGELDADWTQGRALFGGVIMGGALRGLRQRVPSERGLRSVMIGPHQEPVVRQPWIRPS